MRHPLSKFSAVLMHAALAAAAGLASLPGHAADGAESLTYPNIIKIRDGMGARGAIEHEYFERTLRGTFMASAPLLQHLGLAGQQVVPGFPQLMRPCDIDGHLVYHLTTFFEKGGMVTVFAFDKAVALTEGSGWWGNVHWKVITSRDGKPLVLVAQKKQALAVAQSQFGPATDMSPPNSTPTPKETR